MTNDVLTLTKRIHYCFIQGFCPGKGLHMFAFVCFVKNIVINIKLTAFMDLFGVVFAYFGNIRVSHKLEYTRLRVLCGNAVY